MENLDWVPFVFNGLETNIECTKCGRIKRINVDWGIKPRKPRKCGEVDFNLLKLMRGYKGVSVLIKNNPQKIIRVHQIIATVFLGHKIDGYNMIVDHIDSNPLNNDVNNLRIVSQRENNSKERTVKSGLPVGVYYNKLRNAYCSQIKINGKVIYLGLFKDPFSAAIKYQNKLKSL